MANHCSILAWEIPWTEEPGGLQSMESQKSWTRLSHFHFHPLPSRSQRDVGAEACGLCVSCWVLLSLSGLRRSQDRSQGWTDVKSFSWGLFLPPQNSLSFPGTFQREQNLAVSLYSLPQSISLSIFSFINMDCFFILSYVINISKLTFHILSALLLLNDYSSLWEGLFDFSPLFKICS